MATISKQLVISDLKYFAPAIKGVCITKTKCSCAGVMVTSVLIAITIAQTKTI